MHTAMVQMKEARVVQHLSAVVRGEKRIMGVARAT